MARDNKTQHQSWGVSGESASHAEEPVLGSASDCRLQMSG